MASPPELITIPSRNPEEVIFKVPYSAAEWRPSFQPAVGAPYKQTRIRANSQAIINEFGDYTYQFKTSEGGYLWFYFVKHKTATERNTPFKTIWTSKLWKWPNVLNSLIFVPDNAFPLGTQYPIPPDPNNDVTGGTALAFAPNLIERMNLTPEALALSACIIQQYVSDSDTADSPWSLNDLTHMQPTEGFVSWDFNGAKGSITCLHPDIKIPARGKAYTTVINGTTTSAEAAPNVPERIFPATNFEGWEAFVVSDDVVQENGEYFREKVTIIPPEENEPSIV